jgi:hypothetical protein
MLLARANGRPMHNQPEIDAEFYVILDALDRGIVPDAKAAAELVAMGLLEPGPTGLQMTVAARLRLEALRIKREQVIKSIKLFSGDVSSWSAANE